jgi:hypothetical protein
MTWSVSNRNDRQDMSTDVRNIILQATGADTVFHVEDIQSLWSGYGKIMRYGLKGCDRDSVVVKHVKLPQENNHPRGWNTDYSHQRKIRSYQVETAWYRDWSYMCDVHCRLAACLALESCDDEFLMVFEDLDASGFVLRKDAVSTHDMQACLRWLAYFHAIFMAQQPKGLWQIGTYWHLDTRPHELEVLNDKGLKAAATAIDAMLNNARFKTFVHGDAKLANFCFAETNTQADTHVAAVDFQYVGGGCGMKDVAYFIGSCLYEEDCERLEDKILDYYFTQLKVALAKYQPNIDANAVEQEWRDLYPVAWTDFHRFVKGWSPGHWKIHGYSEKLAKRIIAKLGASQEEV